MRWEQGRSVIDALLDARDLERVPARACFISGVGATR
jgi:hypothetical protein